MRSEARSPGEVGAGAKHGDRDGFGGASSRLLRASGNSSADETAEVWLIQARRLLDALDWPADPASIKSTSNGPLATVQSPAEDCSKTAAAILDWALEAAARVLRGDPQPSDAEVYKAAMALPRL